MRMTLIAVSLHCKLMCIMCAGQPLPDDRIAAETGVFFTGGFETTGHTIAWAL